MLKYVNPQKATQKENEDILAYVSSNLYPQFSIRGK